MRRVRTRSVEWLRALLVLRSGRAVSRSWLAGMLWPESTEDQALHNLRRDLMDLRRALGSESSRIISPTKSTLALDLTGAFSDVAEFDAAIDKGNEESLVRAVTLHVGLLLEGCYAEWITIERERRSAACLQALEKLAEESGARGEHLKTLDYLRRAEVLDPLRDSTQRRIMTALAASGDRACALLTYRRFRDLLYAEMGVAPSEETARQYHILCNAAGTGAARGTSGTSDYPPARLCSVPLPRPLTALIGRQEEAADVVDAIRSSRLVTILGSGGVGKTRLAIYAAECASPEFPGGVAFVELASLTDSTLLTHRVAVALGIRNESGAVVGQPAHALAAQIAEHHALLVLDNCEHLSDAVAALSRVLIDLCPDLHILLTSRQPIGMTGETAWRVPPLPTPAPESIPLDGDPAGFALRYPAIQLFVERAKMARQGFKLTGRDDVLAAARICCRLDGIPLAIELAASRARVLSTEQIAARLNDPLHLLAGAGSAGAPRHKTLRASIEWSYEQLSNTEAGLLRRLSIFAGGWTLEAACGIGGTETLDLLSSLIDKSLVLIEQRGSVMRYRMLETIREFAKDKLEEMGEGDAARDCFVGYYVTFVEEADRNLVGPDQGEWHSRIDRELDNLLLAHGWCDRTLGGGQKGLLLLSALRTYWTTRGLFELALQLFVEALVREGAEEQTAARASVLAGAGTLAYHRGLYEEMAGYLDESLAICRKLDDRARVAAALNWLGLAAMAQGDHARAQTLIEESIARSRELDDQTGPRNTLNLEFALAELHRLQRDFDGAARIFEKILALVRDEGNVRAVDVVLLNLAMIEIECGQYDAARARIIEANKVSAEAGLKSFGQAVLQISAALLAAVGDHGRAARLWGASELAGKRMGIRREPADEQFVAPLIARARQMIGDAKFATQEAAGRALSFEDALVEACEQLTDRPFGAVANEPILAYGVS